MGTCEVCGNEYWMTFDVHTVGGNVHTFDSLECAAQRLAPQCEHCGCRILGHGVEVSGRFFCGAGCARRSEMSMAEQVRDAVGVRPS